MRAYTDTSALVAWFNPAAEFALAVTDWCRERAPEFCWNHLVRVELRHHLRRPSGKYAAIAWHADRAGETSRGLNLAAHRVADLLDRGAELSARHAGSSSAGTWDFIPVAAAPHTGSQVSVTCDAAQATPARTVGPALRLFDQPPSCLVPGES